MNAPASDVVAILLSVAGLAYVYGGYAALMVGLAALHRAFSRPPAERSPATSDGTSRPGVTVLLPALDEADALEGKLDDVFDTHYPADRLQVIVISDGSTDGTAERASAYAMTHPERRVDVIAFPENRGRAAAHNAGVRRAVGDVVVATDVATRFEPTTIPALVAPFADARVGVVGGIVSYATSANDDGVGEGYGRYRSMETTLRAAETTLGVLCKTDGPCTAFRATLWHEERDFEDVDQVIVPIARRMGYVAVQAPEARCTDVGNASAAQDVKQRARMTRKALLSTFHRWGWRDAVRDPAFTFALASHKLVRFTSPFLVGTAFVATLRLVSALLGVGAAAAFAALVGGLAWHLVARPTPPHPVLRLARAFLVAQLGFARGVVGWWLGDREGRYAPTRRTKPT